MATHKINGTDFADNLSFQDILDMDPVFTIDDDYLINGNGAMGNINNGDLDAGDNLTGGNGNDTIVGGYINAQGNFVDVLGHDTFYGGDGNDSLLGGSGNDLLFGGTGSDRIRGNDGNDTLEGNQGDDKLFGNSGNDLMSGGSSSTNGDTLYGGDGNDIMYGGIDGNDGGANDDDILYGQDGDDFIHGGDGDDYISGGSGRDNLIGGAGADTFQIFLADNLFDIGFPPLALIKDVVFDFNIGEGDLVEVAQSALSNGITIYSDISDVYSQAINFPTELSGHLLLSGVHGIDLANSVVDNNGNAVDLVITNNVFDGDVNGGAGNDTIYAGLGSNEVFAGKGNDLVHSGLISTFTESGFTDTENSVNILHGGEGDDTIIMDGEGDIPFAVGTFFGDAGRDSLVGNEGNDTLWGGADSDTVRGNDGNDVLVGDDGNDYLFGGEGNDIIFGGSGRDVLNGNSGDDILYANAGYGQGGDGDDVLQGEAGNDILVAGLGANYMLGGSGTDTFKFVSRDASTETQTDLIFDFLRDEGDKIDVTGLGFKEGFHNTLSNHLSINYDDTSNKTLVSGNNSEFEFELIGNVGLNIHDFIGLESGGGGKIICTELHRQGLMSESIFRADQEFGRYLAKHDPEVLIGYWMWAQPVVNLMKKSKLFTHVVKLLAMSWANEMAYHMGATEKRGGLLGKTLMKVGIPTCRVIGKLMNRRKTVQGNS